MVVAYFYIFETRDEELEIELIKREKERKKRKIRVSDNAYRENHNDYESRINEGSIHILKYLKKTHHY